MRPTHEIISQADREMAHRFWWVALVVGIVDAIIIANL